MVAHCCLLGLPYPRKWSPTAMEASWISPQAAVEREQSQWVNQMCCVCWGALLVIGQGQWVEVIAEALSTSRQQLG